MAGRFLRSAEKWMGRFVGEAGSGRIAGRWLEVTLLDLVTRAKVGTKGVKGRF